jgi:predicted aldo/keto reductase-like oxidoreductase
VEYRTLGRSGCAVSALALGTMTFGRETEERDSQAQLDRFLDVGGDLKVPLPSTAVADDVLSAARTNGYEHRDIAVVLRVLSEMAATTEGWELKSATT